MRSHSASLSARRVLLTRRSGLGGASARAIAITPSRFGTSAAGPSAIGHLAPGRLLTRMPSPNNVYHNVHAVRKLVTRMGRIVVSDNVTIDGVMQDPAGDEGFERGGWVGLIANRPELGRFALLEATTSEAMLMGRRTYEWFAGRWPSRTGELADRLNSMPKVVVSSKLGEPAWANTTVLRGDLVEEVRRLKAELEGDIVVPASVGFVRTLLSNGLVDELRLRI